MVHAWFDAHLDLAYLAVNGRDMLAPAHAEMPPAPHPSCVTLPALHSGGVRFCLGTIFTEPGGDESKWAEAYPVGDVERAHVVGRAQLEVYLTWRDRGLIALDRFAALRAQAGVGEVRGGMGVAEVVGLSVPALLARVPKKPELSVGILMENADPIREPDELSWWKERGVVAIGLAWAKSSRYAGGNSTQEGLSDLGLALVREMDRLKIVHDASHLSDRAFSDVCEATPRRIIASHSNCRAIVDPSGANQRHLTDKQIREIVARDGVVGLNLYSKFLTPGLVESGRSTIDQALAHVERICEIAGSCRHVGLGSDMDGGFASDRMPLGIDSPSGLERLAEGLSARNWGDSDVLAFVCGNWMRVFIA